MIALMLANLTSNYLNASALSNEELSQIRQDAENVAKSGLSSVQGIFNDTSKQKDIQSLISENPDTIAQVSHRGTDLNNTPSLGNKQREQTGEECTKNSCVVSYVFSKNATDVRNSKMEEHTGILKDPKTGDVIDNQGWLDVAKHKIKNARKDIDFLTGNYTDCQKEEEQIVSQNVEICDEFYDVKHSNCPVIQKVEIDPHYTYVCNKNREEKEKRCEEVLNLSCSGKKEGGGLTKGIVPSDMKWEYKDSIVTISTNYYWKYSGTRRTQYNRQSDSWTDTTYVCNNCGNFDRNITFNILDLSNFSEFKLVQATILKNLLVKINGAVVYSEQDKKNWQFFFDGTSRGLKLRQVGLNVDLKPYLKEGENNICIQVPKNQENDQIKIHIKQKPICSKWKEEWQSTCEYY